MDSRFHGNDRWVGMSVGGNDRWVGMVEAQWIPVFTGMTGGRGMM